jgi:voltage-gated potassium channel
MTDPKERELPKAAARHLSNQASQKGSHRTLRRGLTFFLATFVIATAGYKIAGWSWIDSIYMVTITIFGVGYGEVHPVDSPWMKIFTMGLILAGCTSLCYVIGGIAQMLAEGEIEKMLGTRKRCKNVDLLQDHTIICGYGRVGQMLASELQAQNQPLVVLDIDPGRVERAIEDGFLALEGNAVDDETLNEVGLFRARTLATVLPDDAKNVFITLTARDLCDSIRIIARAECPTTERKLIRSGASHVVMPAAIGAIRIAQLASKEDIDKNLPEERYRMVHGQPLSCLVTPAVENKVKDEVEELANLASDLAHSIATKKSEVVDAD